MLCFVFCLYGAPHSGKVNDYFKPKNIEELFLDTQKENILEKKKNLYFLFHNKSVRVCLYDKSYYKKECVCVCCVPFFTRG